MAEETYISPDWFQPCIINSYILQRVLVQRDNYLIYNLMYYILNCSYPNEEWIYIFHVTVVWLRNSGSAEFKQMKTFPVQTIQLPIPGRQAAI